MNNTGSKTLNNPVFINRLCVFAPCSLYLRPFRLFPWFLHVSPTNCIHPNPLVRRKEHSHRVAVFVLKLVEKNLWITNCACVIFL